MWTSQDLSEETDAAALAASAAPAEPAGDKVVGQEEK